MVRERSPHDAAQVDKALVPVLDLSQSLCLPERFEELPHAGAGPQPELGHDFIAV